MPRVQSLVTGLVMTSAMVTAMIMNPGQEKIIKKMDIDTIIESHGLDLSKSRPNRDLSNEIIDDITEAQAKGGLSLPPGMRMPADIPEGFDLSSVEPQDDGQFCVFKKITLEGIEKIPVQQCVHKVDTQCYLSYITQVITGFVYSTHSTCVHHAVHPRHRGCVQRELQEEVLHRVRQDRRHRDRGEVYYPQGASVQPPSVRRGQ